MADVTMSPEDVLKLKLEKLKKIVADPNADPLNKAAAESRIKQMEVSGAAQIASAVILPEEVKDNDLAALIQSLQAVVNAGAGVPQKAGATVDRADVREILLEEMKRRKIKFDDFSDDLKSRLDSSRTVQLTINQMGQITQGGLTNADFARRKLVQILLSDLVAKNNAYLYGAAGLGKAQPLHSKILGENGWITFSDVRIGDKVWGQDGKLYEVDGVFDRGIKPVYKVIMNDGGETETCDEHLFKVYSRSRRNKLTMGRNTSAEVKPLSEIMKKLYVSDGCANAFIDVADSIPFKEKEHIIHPYILGVLIGDGGLTMATPVIHCEDDAIIEKVEKLLPDTLEIHMRNNTRRLDCPAYSIVAKKGNDNIFKEELERLGLLYKKSIQKHIPDEYIYDSFENRSELLKGMNDTDGHFSSDNFEYSTSSEELCNDYVELVRSMGFTVRVATRIPSFTDKNGDKKDGLLSYRVKVNFGGAFIPFYLPRKVDYYNVRTKYFGYRYIASVSYIGEMETRCISVTNPEHLYITDDYIVTHNTYIAKELSNAMGWKAIKLNCNQYTSPLDILGGQTVEGYQEGKLVIAWSNQFVREDGTIEKYDGCVLILDELPKIDPNTAGILNDALASIKDYGVNRVTQKKDIPPKITNGRNREFSLGNLFVIATGNVPLNTIDPDYEANFKQDLSLQDRFVGSTYKIIADYRSEFNNIMKGFAFIWLFGIKLRVAIEEAKAISQVFISIRFMENLRETYKVYMEYTKQAKNIGSGNSNIILENPKTLINAIDTVLELIKPAQRDVVRNKIDYEGFKRVVLIKDKLPLDALDTPAEIAEANRIIEKYEQDHKNII